MLYSCAKDGPFQTFSALSPGDSLILKTCHLQAPQLVLALSFALQTIYSHYCIRDSTYSLVTTASFHRQIQPFQATSMFSLACVLFL